MYTPVRCNIFDKGKNVLFSDQKCSEFKHHSYLNITISAKLCSCKEYLKSLNIKC